MKIKYIVVSDLDGTLLDHHTYDFAAAKDAIFKLKQLNIPLILNSSKTQVEIQSIRSQIGNTEPFICENGGLVCDLATHSSDIKYLGIPRQQFLPELAKIKQKLQLQYQSFAEAEVIDIVSWTGLSPDDAANALKREATEPLLWQDTPAKLTEFRAELRKLDLQCVRGGRFHHVMGLFDKASCFALLKSYYGELWQAEVAIVALGDSQNDLPMLEQADFAIVIPSAKGTILKLERDNYFVASQTAPQGWQEGINYFLTNYI